MPKKTNKTKAASTQAAGNQLCESGKSKGRMSACELKNECVNAIQNIVYNTMEEASNVGYELEEYSNILYTMHLFCEEAEDYLNKKYNEKSN